MTTKTVTRNLVVTVAAQDNDVRVAGTLGYDSARPFEAALTLSAGDREITWAMSRDLLLEGTRGNAGDGDVRITLTRGVRAADHTLVMTLNNGLDTAQLALPLATVAEFLVAAYTLVPHGTESDHLDMDFVIDQLLAA